MHKTIVLLFLMVFVAQGIFSQKVISGTVKDEKTSEPLIGAAISVQQDLGTITDLDGKFSISIPITVKEFIVSYTGYESKTILIGKTTTFDISMSDDNLLNEVLVVGYGSIQKSDKTGAIESIKPKTKEVLQYSNFQDFLQGRAAGVQILSNGSELNATKSIRIRGANSLRGDNEPLYVIDGIIVNSSTEDVIDPLKGGSSYLSSQNGLSGINLQDIESIEVLKDASATAIYGSRGANGVILITTKSGASAKTKFTYNSTVKVGKATRLYDMLDANSYVKYIDEFRALQGFQPSFYTYGDGSIAQYLISPENMEAKSDSIPRLPSINWYDKILQNSVAHSHRLTASSGNDKNNYYIGVGFSNATGNVPGTKLSTSDILFRYKHQLTDRISLSPRISTSFTRNNTSKGTENLGSSNASLIRQMTEAAPLGNYTLNNIELDGSNDGPLAWLSDYDDNSKEVRALASLTTDVKLSEVFTYRLLGGLDYRTKNRELWYGTQLFRGSQSNGEAGISYLNRYRYNVDNTIMFKKDLSKNNKLNGTVGFVFDEVITDQSGSTASNFANHDLRAKGISFGQVFTPIQFFKFKETVLSALGRVNYSLNNKYIFTASFRRDGSSKFLGKNKYSFFPSAAIAWKIINEPFMAKSKLWSEAKLRLGYGKTGSQAINPYQTLTRFISTPNLLSNGAGGGTLAVLPDNLGNPNLKWETTDQLNLGFDFGFLEDRIVGSIDVYQKKTSDLLQFLNVGPSVGFATVLANVGDLQNRGVDLGVTATILNSDIKWKVNGSFSINRNKIQNLGVPEAQFGNSLKKAFIGNNVSGGTVFKVPANIFIEGQQAGLFWGFQTNGIIQNAELLSKAPKLNGLAPQLGDILYVDQNNDGNITDIDLTVIGNPNPKFNFGLGSELSYKNLSLNFFVNGVQGNDIANGNLGRMATPNGLPNNNILSKVYTGAWREGATDATYPRLGYDIKGDFTDRMVEDGSFVRLSFVSLNYKLPKIKGLSSANVFVSGNNLLLLTKYSGFDPEVNSFSFDPTRRGIDWSSYPNQKSISVGANIEF